MTELTMTTTPAPAPSAAPKANLEVDVEATQQEVQDEKRPKQGQSGKLLRPKLRLHVEELRHQSSISFFNFVPDVTATLDTALDNIVRYLYTSPERGSTESHTKNSPIWPPFDPSIPATRSVTLFLRDFGGVAYTTGTELDNDHKEMHLSLPYVKHCTTLADPPRELVGVLTHELVHCYQHTAPPKTDQDSKKIPHPPGGLIEGIADFVRLKAHLDPPHWKKPHSASERASNWDAGYQHTAYFLAWIEDVWVGEGAIGMLNDRLLRVGYVGEEKDEVNSDQAGFWKGLFGMEVAELWDAYGRYLDVSHETANDKKACGNWEDEILNAA
ncbi:hypothetical protein N7532_011547 [Penicillium argentinense]|uniref:PBSP domain protein n=1 Tax=Penicillium argentinense TaxID=1131581 RepID=A0A9W9EIQ9_9EURO|nr:uncharacterized protein N7532_011547 [Penicillium argentinense]KAJ5082504.1 hypothetical protein N7532_011547 [Penicillium argentinense]